MAATTLIDRAILRLSGEDVRGFLHGLVTHDLALLTPAGPLWAGLLTPQGKALFDFILWPDGEDVLIDCESEAAGDLARRLALYRLRRKIAIEPVEELAVHWAPCSPAKAGAQSAPGAESRPSPGNGADPRLPELGHRWLAPPGEPAQGWLAHRLSLGVTEGRAELGSDRTLWLECNAAELNGVSFTKGCYVGQENTARMNYRSKVNRRLVVVPADGPGERTRVHYPQLGLAVEHRRVDDLAGAIVPNWLAAVLSPSPSAPSDR
jgi:tRNA-modifying protein YgfZ